jgi:hypothetical protein
MRIARCITYFMLAYLLTIPKATAQGSGIKDPVAVTLINSCLAASGGTQALSSIQDFAASGTSAFDWDSPTQAGAVMKGRVSANQFRFDANLANGTRSWAVTNGAGVLVEVDQTRTKFSYQTALGLRSLSWPVLDFLAALSDPASAISYIGLVSIDQGQVHQIHIQEAYSADADPTGILSSASSRDYFIDPNTFLLVEIKDTQSIGTPAQNYAQSVLFSSYTNVNGLVVPYSVTEMIDGQKTWTVQLSNISFNVGLTDVDFQL